MAVQDRGPDVQEGGVRGGRRAGGAPDDAVQDGGRHEGAVEEGGVGHVCGGRACGIGRAWWRGRGTGTVSWRKRVWAAGLVGVEGGAVHAIGFSKAVYKGI